MPDSRDTTRTGERNAVAPPTVLNVSGPYAAGKDTMLRAVIDHDQRRVVRVSTATTRSSSPSDDPSYRTVTDPELDALTKHGRWIVTSQLEGAVRYGTNLEEIDAIERAGRIAVHSIYPSAEGAGQLRRCLGRRLFSVGLLPSVGDPSEQIEELRHRLVARGRDTSEVIEARLMHQAGAIEYIQQNEIVDTPDGLLPVFDQILVNDELQGSLREIISIWSSHFPPHGLKGSMRTDAEISASLDARAHVGGGYFNPVSMLQDASRVLNVDAISEQLKLNLSSTGEQTFSIAKLYEQLTQATGPGHYVFAIYSRNNYLQAPYIHDEERLLDFERQVCQGTIARVAFIAVEHDAADHGLRNEFQPDRTK